MSVLIITCGIPASGKTTWCKTHLDDNIVYVSRDEVRFSLLKEGEDYFAHEKEVYKEFINRINTGIMANKVVVADATHLNPLSRKKLLKALTKKPDKLIAFVFEVPLSLAIERNSKRKGLLKVPVDAIKNMYNSYVKPSSQEGFNEIYTVWMEEDAH